MRGRAEVGVRVLGSGLNATPPMSSPPLSPQQQLKLQQSLTARRIFLA
eukprot:CAMPEP_0119530214 /NCGR_PEP_ID=MMETSP1344-20130328/44070_1 /TAXON_ID=236787 /ORGANISM="Florenciella parvula, Strain CCMP2471" /LENGTH=47 /DNA_ID= /DNA_START= /DNA_END= /DNA_ORIENTATION=